MQDKIEPVHPIGNNIVSAREAARGFHNKHPDALPVSRNTMNLINFFFQ